MVAEALDRSDKETLDHENVEHEPLTANVEKIYEKNPNVECNDESAKKCEKFPHEPVPHHKLFEGTLDF